MKLKKAMKVLEEHKEFLNQIKDFTDLTTKINKAIDRALKEWKKKGNNVGMIQHTGSDNVASSLDFIGVRQAENIPNGKTT